MEYNPENQSIGEALNKTTITFSSNMHALRVFNEQIGQLADEHDRTVRLQLEGKLQSEFPDFKDKLKHYKNRIKTETENGKNLEATEDTGKDSEAPVNKTEDDARKRILEYYTDQNFLDTLKTFNQQAPVQGKLLRRGALSTLVSFFEVLVSDLIQIFYLNNPAALPADSSTLSLSEIRKCGSIEDAEQHIIYREADSVLRSSTEEQIMYFSKRPKVDLQAIDDRKTYLIEVSQRRNLLIHNNAIVNRQYLSKVSSELVNKHKAEEGKVLNVDQNYLSTAIDEVHLAGLILLQQCWRKWDRSSVKRAESSIQLQLYECLSQERFNLANLIAEYVENLQLLTEAGRRQVVVNHAIALKEIDQNENMEKILSSVDWSACALKFQVALLALRNEEERLCELLPKAVAVNEITKKDLEDWPLFASFRHSQRFTETLEACFPPSEEEYQ